MDADVTIIGAGVIGLAIAEKVSENHDNVFLIEKHLSFGQETSSRNSEVIHEGIRQTAIKNVVDDLLVLGREQIAELEPNIFAIKALFSPSTGIIDSHSLMKQYETNAIINGCQIVYGSEVTAISRIKNGYKIDLFDADKKIYSFTTRIIINSAGLTSDKVSEMVGITDDNLKILFCKGEYFRINPPKNRLIKRLVYPVPHPNMEGIGIHVTIDMGGGVKLGPDVKYLESNIYDYKLTGSKQEAFYRSGPSFT